MKSLPSIAVIAVITLSAIMPSRAVPPVLSADTAFTSEDQVLTLGTEVWGGRDTGNGGSHTLLNGVSFDSQFINASFVGTDLGSGITVKTDGAGYGSHTAISSFSDGVLNSVLEGDSQGGYGQLFVDGLVTGQTYVIQLFAAMTQSGDVGYGPSTPASYFSGTETVTDETQGGSTTLSYGQTYDPDTETYSGSGVYFITDTFVATGNEEYLYLNGSTNPAGLVLQDMVQVRELPEPSTYAMIGLGVLALLGYGKLRSRSA
jgi:hypothetical protein